MEIIFLNCLNGKVREPIKNFLLEHTGKTDLFCLQEVYEKKYNMRKLCEEALRDYSPTFAYKEIEGDNFSSATYVHPRVQILETEILLPNEKDLGLGIVTEVLNQGKRLNICNFQQNIR